MTDQVVRYDGLSGGSFSPGTNITWPGSGDAELVDVVEETSTTGKLYFTRLAGGDGPQDNETITQGGVTASANGNAEDMLYPVYAREDLAISSVGAITWTGPALGATHSFLFDGQTSNVVVGEILTFSGGQTAEVITVVSDAGATGELDVRMISNLDAGLPADNDTFTGDIAGDGTVNGVVHARTYTPLELHRWLSDLNDDEIFTGDDALSVVDATASDRSTDQIITLLGTVAIDDTVAQHMYGGSIEQAGGDTLYSGLDIQVTTPLASTRPVVIQNDAIVTDYWNNAYNPDSIAGSVRLLLKTRDDGVDIDGKRVKGKLLEYGESYFEGGTTLGTATTALALFSAGDGNNNTASGTVAGAPYSSIVITEGYSTEDYNNGNGAVPFGLTFDFGTATAAQAYERWKYIQRRGTSETLFGRNAQLVTGINRNFAHDNETGGALTQNEIIAWGTEITYSNEAGGPFTLGEVVNFVGSGATGRLIYLDDNGLTGTMLFAMDGSTVPLITDTLSGVSSSATADVDTVVSNASFGTGLLIAYNDGGTTGNCYYQALTGLDPADNQTIFGSTSNNSVDVNGTVSTRTINNAFVGVFTGSNYQPNFGIGVDSTDAIAGDIFLDLDGGTQNPPNNQSGVVANLVAGDYVTVFPWDGTSTDINGEAEPDFDQMSLAAALTSGVSTSIDVGTGNIPDNTPQVGTVRVLDNATSQYVRIPYTSHNSDDTFTIDATFNGGTSPINASISNNAFVGYIDQISTGTQESYTAVFGPSSQQVAITARRGGAGAIKTAKTTSTFGSAGFSVNVTRITDV